MRTITSLAASRLDFTSLQQDGIKLLALLLMMGDHANAALHLNQDFLMWLGRGAFPLFALVWGFNLAQRPLTQRQATRLWLWALVAQPVYWQAVAPNVGVLDDINILFVFAIATQWIYWIETFSLKGKWWALLLSSGLLVVWLNHLPTGSFGKTGVFLMALSHALYAQADPARNQAWLASCRPLLACAWMACVVLLNLGGGAIPMLAGLLVTAVVLLVSIALRPPGVLRENRLLPRQFFPVAYVAHLALLWALSLGLPWTA